MADLPPTLINAVRDQRAVLFLGAGASRGAVRRTPESGIHPELKEPPLGDALRDLICDAFFGGALKHRPLTAVAAMAANELGLLPFQKFIHDLLDSFEPGAHHRLLPTFRWKAVASTNFDLIIERAYSEAEAGLQELVQTVKDGDLFDTRMNQANQPLGYYKLHGCIAHYTDESIPLILSNEQYASYSVNRQRFYARFRDLGHEYPVIFAGYSIADPHIQSILFDLTEAKIGRPMYFTLAPGVDDIEARYWAKHRVTCVDMTFEAFLQALDGQITDTARRIPASTGGGSLSIRSHYRVASAKESSALRAYLDTDAVHVHAGMPAQAQDAREFYRGNDQGWGAIQQNLDAKRTVVDSVLVDAVLTSADAQRPADLFMLKGPAGNGKTVALKRIAWESAANYDQLVLYANSAAGLRLEPLEEVYQLTGKRTVLCVDHVALFRNDVLALLKAARARSIPLTLLGTERDNEWHIYCDQLEPYVRQEFQVRYLSEREIENLLSLLERHNALGLLKELSPDARKFAFLQSAERQLLVALHEATLGVPFEDIVLDEYQRVEPDSARRLYLAICALHQFGAPVRAGLISRASGIAFEQFQEAFMAPLENIVEVIEERHARDVFYRARHQHVAEMVFRRALPRQEDKFDLLAGLIGAINVDYSSDKETFSRLIKGRGIAEIFSNIELGRLLYDRVNEASPNDPFVFHQQAVFEMNHAGGSLTQADAAARHAFELNPHSRGIRHTQGEIARRMANETDDPLKKEAYRRFARERINGDVGRLSEYDLNTRARLSIDELREEMKLAGPGHDGRLSSRFVEAVKDAEIALDRALQIFPESPELHATEASFHEVLGQTKDAQAALEKAFSLNPRQDWLATRLARHYEGEGNLPKALAVLDACLKDNPSSKAAHFAYAYCLIKSAGDPGLTLEHLRRSFTEGDANYDAQFLFGRTLFILSRFEDAARTFSSLNNRAPGRFRTGAALPIPSSVGSPQRFNGQIERIEEGYAFLRFNNFPDAIFASRSDSVPELWAALRSRRQATCEIAFNRRGPKAIDVQLA